MNFRRLAAPLLTALCVSTAYAQPAIVKNDLQISGLDPGIKLFMRAKMAQGMNRFTNDNVVLFLHGATSPSTCDFDLRYKDYSWADYLVNKGYVVYMGDYRNYGGSTREKAMDEPAAQSQPVTRSYLALRDVEAMVDHIRRTHNVQKVTLIGWSWGAMMAGYYASLHSENVQKLVLYAPLYSFDNSVPPPKLVQTGTDYKRIMQSLLDYENWMAAHHVDPGLVRKVAAPDSANRRATAGGRFPW